MRRKHTQVAVLEQSADLTQRLALEQAQDRHRPTSGHGRRSPSRRRSAGAGEHLPPVVGCADCVKSSAKTEHGRRLSERLRRWPARATLEALVAPTRWAAHERRLCRATGGAPPMRRLRSSRARALDTCRAPRRTGRSTWARSRLAAPCCTRCASRWPPRSATGSGRRATARMASQAFGLRARSTRATPSASSTASFLTRTCSAAEGGRRGLGRRRCARRLSRLRRARH